MRGRHLTRLSLRAALRTVFSLALLLTVGVAGAATPPSVHAFEIVVHGDNPTRQISTAELKRIYLGEQEFWRGAASGPVQPVLREEGDEAFLKQLGLTRQQITNRWMHLVFSGTAYPPHTAASDQDVLEYVASHPGAIGYVGQYTHRPGTRVLPLVD